MKNFLRGLFFCVLSLAIFNSSSFAQQTSTLTGTVQDTLGAIVVGADVTVTAADGTSKTAVSNARGEFTVSGLAAGTYTVLVKAANFALYENAEVQLAAGERQELLVPLTVEAVAENVDVTANGGVSTDPENNAGATVLKGKDLEALPDDPDELESALQALAGPSAGPNGGQIYIDGFTGDRLPPKDSIREIRINQNPFSAEFDRLGFGRIEILTKPGSDRFRGQVFGNFNDEILNSRNPFATNRAPTALRFFGGNISGPIQKGRSSFFLNVTNRDVGNNAVVNALILDPALNIVPFRQDIAIPNRRLSVEPRFDYQINSKNTLVASYSFTRQSAENQGVGGVTLPSRAFTSSSTENEIRLTETAIINPKTVNETRFEFESSDSTQTGDNSIPTISVGAAFTGGGAQIGNSFTRTNSWELQNYTTTAFGQTSQHAVKFGVRLRGTSITDRSENNFGGTFSFIDLPNFRDTILGLSYPTQFSLVTGNPQQKISQTDVGLFVTDDWRISPALTLSFGLRYENQTNLKQNLNFAPRISFAWSPGAGGAKPPKTVIRGGFGIFYDRFAQNLVLQAQRFNGVEQLNLIVNANDPDPVRRAAAIALLRQAVFTADGVTNAPTAAQILAVLPQSNTIRTIADDLANPYTAQVALGVERQLPARTTLSLFYIGSRTQNFLRSRNINAPICPLQVNCTTAPRPDPTAGNIFQYESTGRLTQNQMIVNFRSLFSSKISLFGNYRLGFARGDSDGAGSFPAYSYDFTGEYGRSSFDIRHSFVIGGNITLPWGITAAPFIIATSGRPFNIVSGEDFNGDSIFNERPTFGQLAARCSELNLTASFCNTSGEDPNAIIPRNYGQSPGNFSVNLRLSKNFGFGGESASAAAPTGGQGGRGGRAGGGAIGGLPGGGHGPGGGGGGGGGEHGPGGGGGGTSGRPYNLNIGLNFNNLLNTVNLGTPIGNLASSRFGQSTSTLGSFGGFGGGGGTGSANRRIEIQARFSW